ncbi:MAG TPA: hypothetical protein VFS00_29840, partial [Polyangiaceae bacterium]|nr:hypothetical protein [Polyangiaceae bacterium]
MMAQVWSPFDASCAGARHVPSPLQRPAPPRQGPPAGTKLGATDVPSGPQRPIAQSLPVSGASPSSASNTGPS